MKTSALSSALTGGLAAKLSAAAQNGTAAPAAPPAPGNSLDLAAFPCLSPLNDPAAFESTGEEPVASALASLNLSSASVRPPGYPALQARPSRWRSVGQAGSLGAQLGKAHPALVVRGPRETLAVAPFAPGRLQR